MCLLLCALVCMCIGMVVLMYATVCVQYNYTVCVCVFVCMHTMYRVTEGPLSTAVSDVVESMKRNTGR